MSQRVLVTGGAGFIGSAVARRLLSRGDAVRVLDDVSRGRRSRLDELRGDLELLIGDIRDAAMVSRASKGVDAVIHLAAINGTAFFYSMPDAVLEVGIKGMLNVLDAARQHGIGRLAIASSSEVYQTPPRIPTDEDVPLVIPDPLEARYSYAGAKLASELLALNYGRTAPFEHVVVCRPHNVYGPDMGREHVIPELALRMRALTRAEAGRVRLPIEGTGRETRAFCYIDDAVEGMVTAIDRGEHLRIYNVGTDVETTILDLVGRIGAWYGREVDAVAGETKPGSTPRRCPDISRLRGLGYAPRVGLDEGLARTLAWYDAHAEELAGATT